MTLTDLELVTGHSGALVFGLNRGTLLARLYARHARVTKSPDTLDDKTTVGDLISAGEAAKILEVTPQRIGQLIREGELKGKKVGHRWLVDQRSVYNYLGRK